MHKKRTIVRFLITYVCVMVPILMVNFFLSRQTIDRLTEQKKQSLTAQVETVCDKLDQAYQHYADNAVRLTTMTDLMPYFILQDEANAINGLNTLSKFNSYDRNVYDIFTYYGTNQIFSANNKRTENMLYFQTTLGVTAESVKTAISMLDSTQLDYAVLWKTKKEGYLLLHFPQNATSPARQVSVNDIVPFSSIVSAMQPLMNSDAMYIRITLADGTRLALYGDGNTRLAMTDADEFSAETVFRNPPNFH